MVYSLLGVWLLGCPLPPPDSLTPLIHRTAVQLAPAATDAVPLCVDDLPSLYMFVYMTWEGLQPFMPPGDTPHEEYSRVLAHILTDVSGDVLVACHAVDDWRRSGVAGTVPFACPPALASSLATALERVARCVKSPTHTHLPQSSTV